MGAAILVFFFDITLEQVSLIVLVNLNPSFYRHPVDRRESCKHIYAENCGNKWQKRFHLDFDINTEIYVMRS